MIKKETGKVANSGATELDELSTEKYKAEIERLKLISGRLQSLCDQIVSQTPSDYTRRQAATLALINDILEKEEVESYSVKDKLEEIYKVSTTDGSGFNIDDVLNPKGDLNLMDLCKELGVKK